MSRLPQTLLHSLEQNFQIDIAAFIKEHDEERPVTSIRKNPFKSVEIPYHTSRVPWTTQGFYLEKRPEFTMDPLLHAGGYYVQEASSMFLEHVLKNLGLTNVPKLALDLCAAPGGKSTLLLSHLHPDSLVISNDVVRSRAKILADNITRWGSANTIVTNNDPAAFKKLPEYFDIVLVDAPCSGSGMFRKAPETYNHWSESNVQLCAQRQKRILSDAVAALKYGGVIIYSTCSFSKEENEDILDWMVEDLHMQPYRIDLNDIWGIEETISTKYKYHGYRFYQHKLKGEGFFLCALVKTDKHCRRSLLKKKPHNSTQLPIHRSYFESLNLDTHAFNDEYFLFPKRWKNTLYEVQETLYIKKAGSFVGQWKNNQLIPNPAFALSRYIPPFYPQVELDKPSALQYLRRADFSVEVAGKGWMIANFQGLHLGWFKALSGRNNNYYPKEWRILKS